MRCATVCKHNSKKFILIFANQINWSFNLYWSFIFANITHMNDTYNSKMLLPSPFLYDSIDSEWPFLVRYVSVWLCFVNGNVLILMMRDERGVILMICLIYTLIWSNIRNTSYFCLENNRFEIQFNETYQLSCLLQCFGRHHVTGMNWTHVIDMSYSGQWPNLKLHAAISNFSCYRNEIYIH